MWFTCNGRIFCLFWVARMWLSCAGAVLLFWGGGGEAERRSHEESPSCNLEAIRRCLGHPAVPVAPLFGSAQVRLRFRDTLVVGPRSRSQTLLAMASNLLAMARRRTWGHTFVQTPQSNVPALGTWKKIHTHKWISGRRFTRFISFP